MTMDDYEWMLATEMNKLWKAKSVYACEKKELLTKF